MELDENPDVHIGEEMITFMGEIPEEMYYLPAITHALNQHRSSSAAISVQYTVVNDTPIGMFCILNFKKIFLCVSESPRTPRAQQVCSFWKKKVLNGGQFSCRLRSEKFDYDKDFWRI